MRKSVHSLDIEFNDNNILSSLFGINDVNIHTLEKINNVKIEYRGNKVKILGSKKSIATTKNELINLVNGDIIAPSGWNEITIDTNEIGSLYNDLDLVANVEGVGIEERKP